MRLVIGMPWYTGPDTSCFARFMDFMTYLGELRQRTIIYNAIGEQLLTYDLPKISPDSPEELGAEPTKEDLDNLGILELGLLDYSRCSLPGKAREMIIESSLAWDADYCLMWDDDMLFDHSLFLRLWRHQVPVVAALAFTARQPYNPVIMTIKESVDSTSGKPMMSSEFVLDYPKDSLITNSDVGGALAFGTGVFLSDMNIFRQMPQPWFESTGAGEDFFFCTKCHQHGIQRYVDTSTKTRHKKWEVEWISEEYYETFKGLNPKIFEDMAGNGLKKEAIA